MSVRYTLGFLTVLWFGLIGTGHATIMPITAEEVECLPSNFEGCLLNREACAAAFTERYRPIVERLQLVKPEVQNTRLPLEMLKLIASCAPRNVVGKLALSCKALLLRMMDVLINARVDYEEGQLALLAKRVSGKEESDWSIFSFLKVKIGWEKPKALPPPITPLSRQMVHYVLSTSDVQSLYFEQVGSLKVLMDAIYLGDKLNMGARYHKDWLQRVEVAPATHNLSWLIDYKTPATKSLVQSCTFQVVDNKITYQEPAWTTPWIPALLRNHSELELSLSGTDLVWCAPDLFDIINLVKLDLSQNQLTHLPRDIARLVNLKELNVDLNDLTALPNEIGLLKGLRKLSLAHNKLTNLPETIGGLERLNHLNLSNNQFSKIPPCLSNLKNIKLIKLSGNWLLETPPKLGNLSQLDRKLLQVKGLESLNREAIYICSQLLADVKSFFDMLGPERATRVLRSFIGDNIFLPAPAQTLFPQANLGELPQGFVAEDMHSMRHLQRETFLKAMHRKARHASQSPVYQQDADPFNLSADTDDTQSFEIPNLQGVHLGAVPLNTSNLIPQETLDVLLKRQTRWG